MSKPSQPARNARIIDRRRVSCSNIFSHRSFGPAPPPPSSATWRSASSPGRRPIRLCFAELISTVAMSFQGRPASFGRCQARVPCLGRLSPTNRLVFSSVLYRCSQATSLVCRGITSAGTRLCCAARQARYSRLKRIRTLLQLMLSSNDTRPAHRAGGGAVHEFPPGNPGRKQGQQPNAQILRDSRSATGSPRPAANFAEAGVARADFL